MVKYLNGEASFMFKSNTERWLDLGCGRKKIKGAIGIDFIPLNCVDIVWDLNVTPYPLETSSFDHIVMNHFLQHCSNVIEVMKEVHRISKSNGIIEICVPHFASDNFNTDITHKTHFGIRSMDYFANNLGFEWNFYTDFKFKIISKKISFRQNKTDYRTKIKFNPFRIIGLEYMINLFPRIYERFFVYIMPPSEVYYKLKVIK